MNRNRVAFHAAGLCLLASSAGAQSFNIDIADLAGAVTSGYGGAAGQTGTWNVLTGGPPYNFSIVDTAGAATTIATSCVAVGNGVGDFTFNNALTTGDDERLMDDCQDVGGVGSTATWTFTGLQNGNYRVITYAWAPDSAAFVSSVSAGGSMDTQNVGGGWPGGHAQGTTYASHCVTVSGGSSVVMTISTVSGFASVNGFQFVKDAPTCGPVSPGTPVCFGDGSGTLCPCGNPGASGAGCASNFPGDPSGVQCSSSATQVGTILTASGSNSLAQQANPATRLVLTANNTTTQPGLFFSGVNTIAGGNGTVFGDGKRCCGGSVKRLQLTDLPGQGAGVNCPATGSTTVDLTNVTPGTVTPGLKLCYQYWYRNPGARSLCGSNFNLSNAITVTWAP